MELLKQYRIAFIGLPDSGKSTLISKLIKYRYNKSINCDEHFLSQTKCINMSEKSPDFYIDIKDIVKFIHSINMVPGAYYNKSIEKYTPDMEQELRIGSLYREDFLLPQLYYKKEI